MLCLGGNRLYSERLRTLTRAYNNAARGNALYNDALQRKDLHQTQVNFVLGLSEHLKSLDLAITNKESEWRDSILGVLSSEIVNDLAFVYPSDGYQVKLDAHVLRGKIHISATVTSTFAKDFPGRIRGTQGRLFQQVVSFSALIGVMELLGIKTVYIDEAFSGSSKKNVKKLNKLLLHLRERGFNLIIIAQDITMAEGIPANRMFLSRSVDNKTVIVQEVEEDHGT